MKRSQSLPSAQLKRSGSPWGDVKKLPGSSRSPVVTRFCWGNGPYWTCRFSLDFSMNKVYYIDDLGIGFPPGSPVTVWFCLEILRKPGDKISPNWSEKNLPQRGCRCHARSRVQGNSQGSFRRERLAQHQWAPAPDRLGTSAQEPRRRWWVLEGYNSIMETAIAFNMLFLGELKEIELTKILEESNKNEMTKQLQLGLDILCTWRNINCM